MIEPKNTAELLLWITFITIVVGCLLGAAVVALGG